MASKSGRQITGNMLAQQIDFISKLFSNDHLRKKYLAFVVDNLKVWMKCECVGIRVLEEGGSIPYDAFVGFSYDFWQEENLLSTSQRQCICPRLAAGCPDDSDRAALTPNGSLWTNDLAGFFRDLSPEKSVRYRCKCLEYGFASVAVIPVRFQERVVGLIHLADPHKDRFSQQQITLLEAASEAIGEIIVRYHAEETQPDQDRALREKIAELKACASGISATCPRGQRDSLATLQQKIEALEVQLFH